MKEENEKKIREKLEEVEEKILLDAAEDAKDADEGVVDGTDVAKQMHEDDVMKRPTRPDDN